MSFIRDVLKNSVACMFIIAVMIGIAILFIYLNEPKQEPVEKAVLAMTDDRVVSKLRVYNDSFMYPIEYDYSEDISDDAELIHIQATEETKSRKLWKFYRNSDNTIDLVIDFISSDNTHIKYDSEPAYMLFKDVTISEIELPEYKRYLSCNNKWYIVDEVNASIVYTSVDKIVTVDDLMQ